MGKQINKIIYVDAGKLKVLEKNPRKITKDKMKKLEDDLRRLPKLFESRPCLVNDESGEMMVYAGYQRMQAGINIGMPQIPCIVETLTKEEEEERTILDNIPAGAWDKAKLAEDWGHKDLEKWGIPGSEISGSNRAKPKGEIEFTSELMESHNYVVLYFSNEIDWQTAVEKLNIKSVKTPDSNEKYMRKGIGRVMNGVEVLKRLK